MELRSKYSSAGLLAQIVVVIGLVMFTTIYFISSIIDILTILKLLLALLLVVMAFNNHVTFKRKYFTLLYLIVAIISGISIFI